MALACLSSVFLITVNAFSFVSPTVFQTSKSISILRKQLNGNKIRRDPRPVVTSSAVSWVDSTVAGKSEDLRLPEAEGGTPWERNAWLEGWRSGEEVVSVFRS